jgi:hypothetical protein
MEARLTRVQMNDGAVLTPPETGVMVVVGPNNVGKSALLREIWTHLGRGWPADLSVLPTVVPEISVLKAAQDHDDLQAWFESHCIRIDNTRTGERSYRRPNAGPIQWEVLRNEFDSDDRALGPNLCPFMGLYANADGRLQLLGGGASLWDPMTDTPSNPLQMLYADRALERTLSDTCFEAFRIPLTLSRIPGSPINLHVGATEFEANIDLDPQYMQAIREMPLLQAQGDGMRSFMGLMLTTVAAAYPIILLDEPEAFLHPPQARLLGRKLAEESAGRAQVIVATHDSDFLTGALDVPDADVSVVRMTRKDRINRTSSLASDQLREMWNDPILRYSNILDGLFHRGVIVCESDSDTRYYGAVLDSSRSREQKPPHDLLFTQCGGKHRIAVVLRALRAVGVPAAVVADFDLFREEATLKELVEAVGRDWEPLAPDWKIVDGQVRTKDRNVSTDYAREQIGEVLERAQRELTREETDRIRTITKTESGWSALKATGVAGLPQGDASVRGARLVEALKATGIFVVPVGELERWHPELGGHGPSWVVDVLVGGLHDRADTSSREFIESVATHLEAEADQ